MTASPKEIFFEKAKTALNDHNFVKLTLSKPWPDKLPLQNIFVRPVLLKNEVKLNFLYRFPTNDETKNFNIDEGFSIIDKAMKTDFRIANLFTTSEDVELKFNKKNDGHLSVRKPAFTKPAEYVHDIKKNRIVEINENLFLQGLGILDDQFRVKPTMTDKYKQIDKYIEIVDSLLKDYQFGDEFSVVDMGCGKGYLTFALYDFLRKQHKIKAKITGVEQRPELITFCNDLATKVYFDNLHFAEGTISTFDATGINMLIALHACDTATDDALAAGIKANADIIIVAPCCHKQIRKQMDASNSLQAILKYGILLERQAEIVTDGMRALILEAHGYKTKVFEFISSEHTAKNVMITAVKHKEVFEHPEIYAQIEKLKSEFGIEFHQLEKNLVS